MFNKNGRECITKRGRSPLIDKEKSPKAKRSKTSIPDITFSRGLGRRAPVGVMGREPHAGCSGQSSGAGWRGGSPPAGGHGGGEAPNESKINLCREERGANGAKRRWRRTTNGRRCEANPRATTSRGARRDAVQGGAQRRRSERRKRREGRARRSVATTQRKPRTGGEERPAEAEPEPVAAMTLRPPRRGVSVGLLTRGREGEQHRPM